MRAHTFLLPLAVALSVAACKRDTTEAAGTTGAAGGETGAASTMAASPATTAGGAYGTAGTTGTTGTAGTTSAMTGAPFAAEVVSVERDGSSITLRETGSTAGTKASHRMVSVDPASASSVSGLKKGDRVTVTCNEAGSSGMSGMSGAGTSATGATGATGSGSLQGCTSVVSVMPVGR